MLKPVGGVSHVRIVYPLQALRAVPTVMTQDPGSRISRPPSSDTPRIFILHRPNLSGERGAELIRGLLAEGWVIVTDFDDHPGHWGMLDAKDQLAFRGYTLYRSAPRTSPRCCARDQPGSHGVSQRHAPRCPTYGTLLNRIR